MDAAQMTTLANIAQIVSGFATLIGVLIAFVAGYIAFQQLKTQRIGHEDQSYSAMFSEYIRVSEEFFRNYQTIPASSDVTSLQRFLKELAKLIHYISLMYETSKRSPEAFSSVDFVLLTNDTDEIEGMINSLRGSFRPIYVESIVGRFQFELLRSKMGEGLTPENDALLKGLERQVREAASSESSTVEDDEHLYASIAATLDTMFHHKVLDAVGSSDQPEAFKMLRSMQQLSMLHGSFAKLNNAIHDRSLEVSMRSFIEAREKRKTDE